MFWVSLVLHRSVLNSGIPYLCSSFSQSWQTQMSCCPTWVLQTCPTTVTMTCSLCLRATELIHHSHIAVQHTASLTPHTPGSSRGALGSITDIRLRLGTVSSWDWNAVTHGKVQRRSFFCLTFPPVTMLLFVCFSELCRDFIVNFS